MAYTAAMYVLYFLKNGAITRYDRLMAIDEKRGTLACYIPVCCCTSELREYPCVTCNCLF